MEKLGTFLGTVDYVVILLTLAICVAIGFYFKKQHGKRTTVTEYFLGNRKMSIFPIAMSIVATTISAVPMVSGIGELYAFGIEYCMITFGFAFGTVLASYLVIPVFRYMDYVSIYEYLENRFDRSVRVGFSFFYILMNVISSAVVLYLPSLLLANVTGLPYWVTSTISGILCTSYCVVGGFKSVVWTDVVQFVFIIVSLVVILWRGTTTAGGSSYVWKNAIIDAFFANITLFDLTRKRFTVVTATLFGIFTSFQFYTTSQAVLQRILSVKDVKTAQRSLAITIIARIIFALLAIGAAAVIYAHFHRCDPLQRSKETGVKTSDLILLYYLQVFLSDIPGLSGLVFAGILSSALSTLSSFINSFAAATLQDFLKPFCPGLVNTEKRQLLISRVLTAVFGCLVLVISFVIPYLGGAIKAFVSINGAVGGPLTGVMFLALFFPRANKKACILGLVVGVGFCSWLTFANSMYKTRYQTLPLSTVGCSRNESTTLLFESSNTTFLNETSTLNGTKIYLENEKYVFPLYKLSFVLYGPLGLILTTFLGWLASLVFGNERAVDSRLLSPLVTRTRNQEMTLAPSADEEEEQEKNNIKMEINGAERRTFVNLQQVDTAYKNKNDRESLSHELFLDTNPRDGAGNHLVEQGV